MMETIKSRSHNISERRSIPSPPSSRKNRSPTSKLKLRSATSADATLQPRNKSELSELRSFEQDDKPGQIESVQHVTEYRSAEEGFNNNVLSIVGEGEREEAGAHPGADLKNKGLSRHVTHQSGRDQARSSPTKFRLHKQTFPNLSDTSSLGISESTELLRLIVAHVDAHFVRSEAPGERNSRRWHELRLNAHCFCELFYAFCKAPRSSLDSQADEEKEGARDEEHGEADQDDEDIEDEQEQAETTSAFGVADILGEGDAPEEPVHDQLINSTAKMDRVKGVFLPQLTGTSRQRDPAKDFVKPFAAESYAGFTDPEDERSQGHSEYPDILNPILQPEVSYLLETASQGTVGDVDSDEDVDPFTRGWINRIRADQRSQDRERKLRFLEKTIMKLKAEGVAEKDMPHRMIEDARRKFNETLPMDDAVVQEQLNISNFDDLMLKPSSRLISLRDGLS